MRALADKCNLSVNANSRIERGLSSPTVSSLHSLAVALNVPIADFFEEGQPSPTVYVKADRRQRSHFNGRSLEILGVGFLEPMTAPFLVTLEPGVGNSAGPITHPGEEFVLCLEGRIEFDILGETYTLEEGDSLLFKCDQPHCWRNPSAAPTRFLVVFVGSEGQTISAEDPLEGADLSESHL